MTDEIKKEDVIETSIDETIEKEEPKLKDKPLSKLEDFKDIRIYLLSSVFLLTICTRLFYVLTKHISFGVLFGVSTTLLIILILSNAYIKKPVLKWIYFLITSIILGVFMFDTFVLVRQIDFLNNYKGYQNEKIINRTATNLGNRFETNKDTDGIFTGYTVDRNGILQIEKSDNGVHWYVTDVINEKVD